MITRDIERSAVIVGTQRSPGETVMKSESPMISSAGLEASHCRIMLSLCLK